MNRSDGLIESQISGRKIVIWPWGPPLAWSDDAMEMKLPDSPWFWHEGYLVVSLEAFEDLWGSAVASDATPEVLDVARHPVREFRVEPIRRGPQNGLKVVIDPGHGGKDLGAKDELGTLEKDIVLAIGVKVGALLRELGYQVKLTRNDDSYPTLSERVQLANDWSADLMLSLHCNSAPRLAATGIETYILSREASDPRALALAQFENAFESEKVGSGDLLSQMLGDVARSAQESASTGLATLFHRTVASHIDTDNRGVRKAPFFVLTGTTMPAFLVELGFLSNREEAARLRQPEYQARLAKSVVEGVEAIREYLSARAGDTNLKSEPTH